MDINHLQLPPRLLTDLYARSLIHTNENPVPEPGQGVKRTELNEWRWLGENKKNILVLVKYEGSVHLPDKELQFLTNMLSACQLSLADVAIVNLLKQPQQSYKDLMDQFKSKVALLFDIEPSGLGLPMNFPFFQIQPFAACSFLYVPSLSVLEKDKVLKSKLWVSLRRLFNI